MMLMRSTTTTTTLLLLSSFLSVASAHSNDDIACVTIQSFPTEGCSGDPDVEQSAPMPTTPIPFDNPTFGKCSINHQYCDMLNGPAFKQTIFVASGTCDKEQAMVVQDQVYENGKCYNGQGNSVLVMCVEGSCPMEKSMDDSVVGRNLLLDEDAVWMASDNGAAATIRGTTTTMEA